MTNFLLANIGNIIFVFAIIAILIILFRIGQKKKIKQMLLYFVTIAERDFGGGTGELKFSAVSTWIYEKMPTLAKVLFTKKQIDQLIEEAVEWMKMYLATNDKAKAKVTAEKRV